jgi:hypothetical protein
VVNRVIFYNDSFWPHPEIGDTGERELWAGNVAYEIGDLPKAREYFDVANKKSRGRCTSWLPLAVRPCILRNVRNYNITA